MSTPGMYLDKMVSCQSISNRKKNMFIMLFALFSHMGMMIRSYGTAINVPVTIHKTLNSKQNTHTPTQKKQQQQTTLLFHVYDGVRFAENKIHRTAPFMDHDGKLNECSPVPLLCVHNFYIHML